MTIRRNWRTHSHVRDTRYSTDRLIKFNRELPTLRTRAPAEKFSPLQLLPCGAAVCWCFRFQFGGTFSKNICRISMPEIPARAFNPLGNFQDAPVELTRVRIELRRSFRWDTNVQKKKFFITFDGLPYRFDT